MSSEEEIEILLRAAYPILCVYSHEERRVEAALVGILNRRNKKYGYNTPVFYWSITEGLMALSKNGPVKTEKIQNPIQILDHIGESDKPAIFILRDFYNYIGEGAGVTAQRKLKDLAYFLTQSASQRHIVIVGPYFEIPTSLEKLVAVVDFELPNEEELRKIVQDSLLTVRLENKWKKLQKNTAELDAIVRATQGLTAFEAENVLAKSLVATKGIDTRIILTEKKHIIRKSGVLEFYEPEGGMEQVGGLENLKHWLLERGKAFSSEANKYGLPVPKGVLIIGIPGTGKSLISKAIGIAWAMPILRMDVGALFGSFVGQSEANMRKALKTAEALAPCILWIDELEKGLGSSNKGGNDGGTTSRVFGSFLSWMQEKKSPVFVAATANDVSQLPPEMLRKGRFDEIFFSDLPTEGEREAILRIHLGRFKRESENYDIGLLAGATDGFSGAELEQVVIDGLYRGFYNGRELANEDLQASVVNTIPLSKTMSEQIKELRAWALARARPAGNLSDGEEKDSSPRRGRALDLREVL